MFPGDPAIAGIGRLAYRSQHLPRPRTRSCDCRGVVFL